MYGRNKLAAVLIVLCLFILLGLWRLDRREQAAYNTWAQERNRILDAEEASREAANPKNGGQTPLRKCYKYCKNVVIDAVDDKRTMW